MSFFLFLGEQATLNVFFLLHDRGIREQVQQSGAFQSLWSHHNCSLTDLHGEMGKSYGKRCEKGRGDELKPLMVHAITITTSFIVATGGKITLTKHTRGFETQRVY